MRNFTMIASVSIPISNYGDSGTPADIAIMLSKEFGKDSKVHVRMYSNDGYSIAAAVIDGKLVTE